MTSHTPNPDLGGPLYGKDPWPLRFHTHTFGAVCFNTLACSIIYSRHQFGTRKMGYDGKYYDTPSGQPPFEHWRDEWMAGYGVCPVDGRTFSTFVEIEWTSIDGREHVTSIDFDKMFKDRLILHTVDRSEVKEAWLDAKSIHPVNPHILLEVNDCTVSVFMRALVAAKEQRIPGSGHGYLRDDLILAWSHTY